MLLVEDEKKVADFVARGLRAETYALDVAYDGTIGWEMASKRQYDLIILDLMLPGMNGAELLRRVRQNGGTAAVLVLTARDSTNDKVDDGFPTKLIHTVRGAGYSISDGKEI